MIGDAMLAVGVSLVVYSAISAGSETCKPVIVVIHHQGCANARRSAESTNRPAAGVAVPSVMPDGPVDETNRQTCWN